MEIQTYATYRLSQWYEKSGNLERDLIKCELLLKTYRDCDRKYRIWLEETEKRKARLIAGLQ